METKDYIHNRGNIGLDITCSTMSLKLRMKLKEIIEKRLNIKIVIGPNTNDISIPSPVDIKDIQKVLQIFKETQEDLRIPGFINSIIKEERD